MIRCCLCALILMSLAVPADAHRKRSVRKTMATVRATDTGNTLDVMIWSRVAGERADQLRARFDLDRSGTFEEAEALLVGDALGPEAIGGFLVRLDGKARPPTTVDARAKVADDGAVEVAILLTYGASAFSAIELAARADRERPGAPALIGELAVLPPLRILESKPGVRGAVVGPAVLIPGSTMLTARFVVPEPAARRPSSTTEKEP